MIARFTAGNVALNKPASQTSTWEQMVANLAVDGRYDTVACTNKHFHPWWAVDLRAAYDVRRVTVTNDHNKAVSEYRRTCFIRACN